MNAAAQCRRDMDLADARARIRDHGKNRLVADCFSQERASAVIGQMREKGYTVRDFGLTVMVWYPPRPVADAA